MGKESAGKACPNGTNTCNAKDGDGESADSDLPPIGVNKGSMTVKRMNELVSRYDKPLGYVSRVSTISEYMSTLSPFEINVCKKTFRARFQILVHLFIELLRTYRLMPAQIHPSA